MDNNNNNNFINPDNQPQNVNYNMPQQNTDYSGMQQNVNYNMPQQNADYSGMQQNANYSMPQQNADYSGMQQNVNFNMPQQNANYSMPQQNTDYSGTQQNVNYSGMQQNTDYSGMQQNVNYNMPQQNIAYSNHAQQDIFYSQQQPQQPVEYTGKAKKLKKVKKSWSKGKIAAVSCGGAALVAGIACAIIFILVPMLKPAKDVVVDAFESTFDDVRENVYGEDIYGMQEILETYYTKGGDMSFTMSLDKLPETEGIDLTKYQLKSDGSYNPVDKLVNYSTAIKYNDEDIIGIDFIGTKDNTYFIVDELINGYFKLPNEDILNKLAASPIGQAMDLSNMPNYPVSIDYFPEINTASSTDGTEVVTEYVDAIEKLWDGVDVSKQGKAKINLHDDVVVATEYYLTFKEKDIEEALESYIDGLMSEAGTVGMLAGSSADFDEETYKMAITQLKAMIPSTISDDLVVRVYIKDDKVVKITSNPKGNIFGTELGCDFSMDITDTHMRLDTTVYAAGENLDIVCDIKCENGKTEGEIVFAAGGESFSIKLDGTTVSDDSKASDTMKIDMYESGRCVAVINLSSSLNKNDGAYEGSVSISADGTDAITVSYNGTIKNEKGVSLDMTLDDLTISCDGESFSVGSVSYSIDTTKVSAKDIDSSIPVYDMLTLTEEDFNKIGMDNETRIMDWMQKISELDIFSALTTTNPGMDNNGNSNDIWDIEAPVEDVKPSGVEEIPEVDATGTDSATNAAKNMILYGGYDNSASVEIIADFEGFTVGEAQGSIISYDDSEGCGIMYSIVNMNYAEFLSDYVESWKADSSITDIVPLTTINVDGEEVSYISHKFKDINSTEWGIYVFVKEIDSENVLCMYAVANTGHLGFDELKQGISPKTGYRLVK